MIWFKKKRACIHCEKKTLRNFEDQPTCGACQMEILMAREAPRSCPVDGTRMLKENNHDVIIDRCPECGGIWLDAGEIEAIKQAASHEGIAIGMVIG